MKKMQRDGALEELTENVRVIQEFQFVILLQPLRAQEELEVSQHCVFQRHIDIGAFLRIVA